MENRQTKRRLPNGVAAQVAAATGYSRWYVLDIHHGKASNPSIKHLLDLALRDRYAYAVELERQRHATAILNGEEPCS